MKRQTTAPIPTVWERIAAKQIEMNALFEEAVQDVFKETEGAAFLGEDNVAFALYWLLAVQANPEVMSGLFNAADFGVKAPLFDKLVVAYNANSAGKAILDGPYDVLSQDVLRYAMDAKLEFDSAAKTNQKYRQVVRDAPQYRKPPKGRTPPPPPTNLLPTT